MLHPPPKRLREEQQGKTTSKVGPLPASDSQVELLNGDCFARMISYWALVCSCFTKELTLQDIEDGVDGADVAPTKEEARNAEQAKETSTCTMAGRGRCVPWELEGSFSPGSDIACALTPSLPVVAFTPAPPPFVSSDTLQSEDLEQGLYPG